MANTITIPVATGDLAAFLKGQLLPSIPPIRGSGSSANPADQHNQYVLPTASQLASWRTVFQSLLAGAWGTAHLQARTISSTYNVVQFLDTSTGRVFYVVMEGVPGEIPAPADHPSGAKTARKVWTGSSGMKGLFAVLVNQSRLKSKLPSLSARIPVTKPRSKPKLAPSPR